jgi:small nuclear ribonucleoprotein (snRNP)-like protein
MSDAPETTGTSKSPADFLKGIRGKRVVVKLNSGVDYRGVLACLDGYMNIAMEQTEVGARYFRVWLMGTRGIASSCCCSLYMGRAASATGYLGGAEREGCSALL